MITSLVTWAKLLHIVSAEMADRFNTLSVTQAKLSHLPSTGREMRILAKGQCSAAGKVIVGLASHLPCVTDSVVYPPSGSMTGGRATST